MKNVLITGGAGFIGSSLARFLSAKHPEFKVTILDLKEKFDKKHFNENFEIIELDIRELKNFEKINNRNFDYIFHLAAQTSGAISQEEPELDVDTNVKGTLNICNYARKVNCKKIIFSSSMGVYGDYGDPISESFELRPKSNYGVSKVAGEYYIKMFSQFDLNYTIFRIFNAYGPGQDMHNMRQGMASIFMAQLIRDRRIFTTGGFDRYRDFVYIDDIVLAMYLAMDDLDNDVFNIGSGVKTTVADLIDSLIEVSGEPKDSIEVENMGGHEGDQHGTYADNSKLKKKGWQPKTDFQEGLENMYNFAVRELT